MLGSKRGHTDGPGDDMDELASRTRLRTLETPSTSAAAAGTSLSQHPTPAPIATVFNPPTAASPRRSTRREQAVEPLVPDLTVQEVLFRDAHWNGKLDKVSSSARRLHLTRH